ncbi:F-box domain containing protein [Tanacetum coccineum]
MSRRRRVSNSNDIISQMPDDVLVMILSFLPIKEAVVTSCLSSRWRFLWGNVTRLKFEATPNFLIGDDSKWYKYMNQVNNVIHSYNLSIVKDFRIRFNVSNRHSAVINEWLQYAVNKKVEFLELNFMDHNDRFADYYFPVRLFDTQLNRRPSPNTMFVEILSLKKLVLKKVNVTEAILQEFLTNCPHLETINSVNVDSFPVLPNVKKLRLVIGGKKSDCLLDLASILNACPNLQTFEIKPIWTSPIISKRKARDATNPIEHLKLVKIIGYYGRKCDLELAEYLMNVSVALKKIVIDPFRYDSGLSPTAINFILDPEAALVTINDQIKSKLPPGVELCIHEDRYTC